MHLEFLIEDTSGKQTLEILLPELLPEEATYSVHAYRGIGRIPKGLRAKGDPRHRILLDQLPRLLRGYGNVFAKYPKDYRGAVVVVCDLDDKSQKEFLAELESLLQTCPHPPTTKFCLAIEEGEAWFLGDQIAIKKAYPRAKQKVLMEYKQDSICGTWEILADAVYDGGSIKLREQPWHVIGLQKTLWAREIAPRMNIEKNASPSFNSFREAVRSLCNQNSAK